MWALVPKDQQVLPQEILPFELGAMHCDCSHVLYCSYICIIVYARLFLVLFHTCAATIDVSVLHHHSCYHSIRNFIYSSCHLLFSYLLFMTFVAAHDTYLHVTFIIHTDEWRSR
jgi:hypothetical protein